MSEEHTQSSQPNQPDLTHRAAEDPWLDEDDPWGSSAPESASSYQSAHSAESASTTEPTVARSPRSGRPPRTPSARSSIAAQSAPAPALRRSRSPRSTQSSRSPKSLDQSSGQSTGQAAGWDSSVAQAAGYVVTVIERLRPQLRQAQQLWGRSLDRIRQQLPAAWSAQLSDRVLGGIVAGVLIVVLWLLPSLVLGRSAPVAKVPVAPVTSTETPSSSVDRPTAVDSAPPVLDLPPEQGLIAAIQDQVTEITNQYSPGLIQTVQANFRRSVLMVTIGDGWYDLSPLRQGQLANDLLLRSRDLEFAKLELLSPDGLLLARSPVIGDTMIVLSQPPL
ncbi:MAG TPA: hypothetical protein V6C88_06400 [Chroococcidiopsis sp.]